MKRYVLTRPAERDLDHIKHYLIERAGVRVARRVVGEIRSAILLLSSKPGIGHVREDLTGLPVKFWPVYSYLIVYDPITKPLEIIRVVHGAQDLEVMLARGSTQ